MADYFIHAISMTRWNLDSSHTLQVPLPMETSDSPLGVCPFCGSLLNVGSVIIEYEASGERRIYADCATCDEPVHPK